MGWTPQRRDARTPLYHLMRLLSLDHATGIAYDQSYLKVIDLPWCVTCLDLLRKFPHPKITPWAYRLDGRLTPMNRTDRLLAIVLELQKKGYSLSEGYFLPPLHFTTEEALILALGSDFIGHTFDDQYRAAAEAAYRKIDAVLPDTLRQEVSYLSTNISFFAANPLDEKQRENVRQLRSAIAERRTVHFHYTKKLATSSEATMREVNPYSLARLANDWLLMGYCHLRQDLRVF